MTKILTFSSNFSNDSDIIFYNIVGNFIPPEWRSLANSDGKTLSKTARQLLSLIVSCFETGDYIDSEELQKSYYFFESKLGLCQNFIKTSWRIRQCLVELEQGIRTIIKNYTRCRNILCITLVKNFQSYSQNVSVEAEINGSVACIN